jgi:hypothetical protein
MGNGEIWRDRQLRDYRHANGECFKCGEKYDPTHQCKKPAHELHALQTEEEEAELLSEEVLNMMELQDLNDAKLLSLSLNAIAGNEASETIRLRALVDNQVLIILVDSSSSGSFLNANMVARLQCKVQQTTPVSVRLPNEQTITCDSVVPDFTWWTQGETFHTPMRVLNIGAYDAILGVDWLKEHGPIKGDWVTMRMKVTNAVKRIWLHGITPTSTLSLHEMPLEHLAKWTKGNDVWAMAVIHTDIEHSTATVPTQVQAILEEFAPVFAEPTSLPPARPYDHAITLNPEAVPFNV